MLGDHDRLKPLQASAYNRMHPATIAIKRGIIVSLPGSLPHGYRHVETLNSFYFVEAADKTFFGCLESGIQVTSRNLERERGAEDTGSYDEDIHIVVFDSLMRGVRVVTYTRSDSWHFVGSNTDADARAAYEDAAVG